MERKSGKWREDGRRKMEGGQLGRLKRGWGGMLGCTKFATQRLWCIYALRGMYKSFRILGACVVLLGVGLGLDGWMGKTELLIGVL